MRKAGTTKSGGNDSGLVVAYKAPTDELAWKKGCLCLVSEESFTSQVVRKDKKFYLYLASIISTWWLSNCAPYSPEFTVL